MIQGSVGEFLGFQTAWSQPLFPCALSGCDLLISGLMKTDNDRSFTWPREGEGVTRSLVENL